MTDWNTPFWTESVSRTVADYHYPIFKLLDDSAAKYPDQAYTIFNGATKTYAQVRNTADRIANFLAVKALERGTRWRFCFFGVCWIKRAGPIPVQKRFYSMWKEHSGTGQDSGNGHRHIHVDAESRSGMEDSIKIECLLPGLFCIPIAIICLRWIKIDTKK